MKKQLELRDENVNKKWAKKKMRNPGENKNKLMENKVRIILMEHNG